MISEAKADAVEELLARRQVGETLSLDEIARRTGVSRRTVIEIDQGRRPDYRTRREQRQARAASPWLEDGPLVRCSICGALVRIPCQACATRARPGQRRGPGFDRSGADELRLDLTPDARGRYETVLARKRQEGEPDAVAVGEL